MKQVMPKWSLNYKKIGEAYLRHMTAIVQQESG